MPTFSLLIPTVGSQHLECALASASHQLGPGDEVIVIHDTTDYIVQTVKPVVESFGPQFRYLEYPGPNGHTYGHDQLNYGIRQARGQYIHCSDDDDIWTDNALDSMRRAVAVYPNQPILFRFMSWHYMVYWDLYGMIAMNHVGGHCLVVPNVPGKIGRWTEQYQGDFDYIVSTVELWGGIDNVIWKDELIAHARPNNEERQRILDLAKRPVAS